MTSPGDRCRDLFLSSLFAAITLCGGYLFSLIG